MKQKSLKKTMSISQCIPQKSIKIWKKNQTFLEKNIIELRLFQLKKRDKPSLNR